MAAPTQVGQTRGVSNVPVFYIPGPGEQPNIAAAYWSAWTGERNKYAMQWHLARMRALDPSARAKALNEQYKAQTDRLAKGWAAQSEGQKTLRAIMPGMISLVKAQMDNATKAQIANAKASADILIAGAGGKMSDAEREFSGQATQLVRELDAAREAGDAVGEANALSRLQATRDQADAFFGREGPKRRAFDNIVADAVRSMGSADDNTKAGAIQLLTRDPGELAPQVQAGSLSAGQALEQVAPVLQSFGIEPSALVGPRSETSRSSSTRGPAPSTQTLTPSTGAQAPASPLAVPGGLGSRTGPSDEELRALVEGPDIGSLFDNPYGGFGDPIPGYTRPSRKAREFSRLEQANPTQLLDFIEGAGRAAKGGTVREGIQSGREDRAAMLAAAKPDVAQKKPGAEAEVLPKEKKTRKQKRAGEPTAEERAAFASGELDLAHFIEPSRKTRRKRKKAEAGGEQSQMSDVQEPDTVWTDMSIEEYLRSKGRLPKEATP